MIKFKDKLSRDEKRNLYNNIDKDKVEKIKKALKEQKGKNDKSYPYKAGISTIIGLTFLSGIAAVFMTILALHNESGLILNQFIYLSVIDATIFYWIMAFFFILFVSLGLWIISHEMTSEKKIDLTDHSITAPKKSISTQLVTIDYKEIVAVYVGKLGYSNRFLKIISPQEKLIIPSFMLSNNDFDNLMNELAARIRYTA